MYNILKSYCLRSKRSSYRMVIILCPVIFALIFGIYAINSSFLKKREMDVFFSFYTILASFSLSFFVPLVYESDKIAGNYANDLACGIDRKIIFFSRFLYIFILLNIIEIIGGIIMIGLLVFFGREISLLNLLVYYGISSIMLMEMIPIYQFLSLMFNYSISILFGAFFTLTAILLGTTGLGENIWFVFPFVWPVKIIFDYAKAVIGVKYVLDFYLMSICVTLINIGVFTFWYKRWDGSSKMEE